MSTTGQQIDAYVYDAPTAPATATPRPALHDQPGTAAGRNAPAMRRRSRRSLG
jgi:hypothetical protein